MTGDEDDDLGELAELMESNGGNCGHVRRAGKWVDLASGDYVRSGLENEPRTHGTRYTYQNIGCKCRKCKAWNAARVRSQKLPRATNE